MALEDARMTTAKSILAFVLALGYLAHEMLIQPVALVVIFALMIGYALAFVL